MSIETTAPPTQPLEVILIILHLKSVKHLVGLALLNLSLTENIYNKT